MSRLLLRMACQCACVLLLAYSSLVHSQASESQLGLADAIARSLERNLDLKSFKFDLEAQQARIQQARARPAPDVGLLVENALGTGERTGFDAAETTLSIGYSLERGALQRRVAVAEAGNVLLESEATIRRLDVAAETARRFIAVLAGQEVLVAARNATKLAEETAVAVRARVRAAKVPQAEEARAEAQLARVRLEEEHAEHELSSARQRLAALWGSTQPDFAAVRGDIMTLPVLEEFSALRVRLEGNVEIERLVSEKRLRETESRLAEMRRRPPWHLTAGVRRFEDNNDHAFVVGLTVPIANRDSWQGAAAEARAQAAQVDARAEALRVQLDAELFGVYQELRHSYAEVATLRNEVLPRVESAVEQSRYAYERGRYGYIEWVAAQRELVELRRALLDASADAHRQRIEIERLTGISLGNPPQR